MSAESIDEMGPVDFLVLEWPDRQPTGEAMPFLIDLVDRGIIHVLDLAFITKDGDGNVAQIEIADVGGEYAVFEGVSTGMIGEDDIAEAGSAIEANTSAALLIYENTWAAPLARALRASGAQMVAGGRIPVQAILASLEASEAGARN